MRHTKGEKMNKEKTFEIEIAKAFGQELVDKIKKLPDETDLYEQEGTRNHIMSSYLTSNYDRTPSIYHKRLLYPAPCFTKN